MKTITILIIAVFLGTTIAYSQNDPKELFEKNKCNTCHSVPKANIKSKMPTKYPELPDKLLKETKIDELVKFIKQETNLKGKKHGLKFKGSDDELKAILKWLQEMK